MSFNNYPSKTKVNLQIISSLEKDYLYMFIWHALPVFGILFKPID